MNRCGSRWLIAIIVIAVVIRLGAALFMGDKVVALPGIYDQLSYDGLAQRVLAGYGFSFGQSWWPATAANEPTAHWSFLYTLYLTSIYLLLGYHPLAARIVQSILAGVLIPWLTYRLAYRTFGFKVGQFAAAISAIYLYFIYFAAALMTESFFIICILCTFDLAEGIKDSKHHLKSKWIWLGLAMGFSVLLRQTFLPVIGLVGTWLWIASPGQRKHTIVRFLSSLLLVIVMIFPWTLRNYLVFKQFVILNTNAGFAFFWANHPLHGIDFSTFSVEEFPYQDVIPDQFKSLDEASLEKELMRQGLQFVVDDPGRYLLLSLSRLKGQFKFWPTDQSGFISNISRVGSFGVFLPFMIYGTWLALKRLHNQQQSMNKTKAETTIKSQFMKWIQSPISLWLGFFLLYTGIHLLSWSAIRYRLPTDAVMIIFAGLGLADLSERIFRKFQLSPNKVN